MYDIGIDLYNYVLYIYRLDRIYYYFCFKLYVVIFLNFCVVLDNNSKYSFIEYCFNRERNYM